MLTDAQKAEMNSGCLGWDCSVQTQTEFVGKNGLLPFNNRFLLQTFIGIFRSKVPAVLLMNSDPGDNITTIMAQSFNEAGVPRP